MRKRKKPLFVFDLDGTLADLRHRLFHIHQTPKDWQAFFNECDADLPIRWTCQLLKALQGYHPNAHFAILSGRMDHVRQKTQTWLGLYKIRYDSLWMRAENDYRDDVIVKGELMDQLLGPAFELRFIVEDRQKVVDMWRARGYNVLQCNKWEEKPGIYDGK